MNSCGLINRQASNTHGNYMAGAPYDVVIVPGMPFNNKKINPIYKARMLWAKWLFDRHIAKNIIFSGSAVHSPYIEAQAMKIMADSLGIPAAHTFVESRAQHGTENVDFGIQLAHQLGFKKIAVATDPFQSKFLKRFIDVCKINVALVPFPFQLMPMYYKHTFPHINASDAFIKNFVPIEKRDVAQRD